MTDQEQILTSLLNCRRVDLYSGDRSLTERQREQFDQMQARKLSGEPLQYILGHCEFMGIKLRVDKRVLIPRPETEIMIEEAIKEIHRTWKNQPVDILDVGTGSGNIAIALAKEGANVTTIDISPDALDAARVNAQYNRVEDKISFVCQDMETFLRQAIQDKQAFHVIVSNPPYIATSQLARLPKDVQQEPKIALDGGEDGLKYLRQIFMFGQQLLKPEGSLFCEIGDGQRPDIEEMLGNLNLKGFDFIKDYNKIDRVVTLTNNASS